MKTETLAIRLKRFRLEKDWTLERVAKKVHVHRATILRAERGFPVMERTAYKLEKLIRGNGNGNSMGRSRTEKPQPTNAA